MVDFFKCIDFPFPLFIALIDNCFVKTHFVDTVIIQVVFNLPFTVLKNSGKHHLAILHTTFLQNLGHVIHVIHVGHVVNMQMRLTKITDC